MATTNYLVIRLHPDSPVGGGTFVAYLEGLLIQVLSTDGSQTLLGQVQIGVADLTLMQVPWQSNEYISTVSKVLVDGTPQDTGATTYGKNLTFESSTGITMGATAYDPAVVAAEIAGITPPPDAFKNSPAAAGVPASSDPVTVPLSQPIAAYVPAGTYVNFGYVYTSINVNWGGTGSAFSFTASTSAPANATTTVSFASTAGIAAGMALTPAPGIPPNTTVTAVKDTTVTFSNNVNLNSGSEVTFVYAASFSHQASTNANAANTNTVSFSNTAGIAVGMAVAPITGSIPTGTTVTSVTSTTVTFNNNVNLNSNPVTVTFVANLSSGIVQHTEFFQSGDTTYYTLAAVATAVIEIPAPAAVPDSPAGTNTYTNVLIVASRNGLPIPVSNDFYNVLVNVVPAGEQLPTPNAFQGIAPEDTSLYLTLPAPPTNITAIDFALSGDGSAPSFDNLVLAMQQALEYDTFFKTSTGVADISELTQEQCVRMAYDIVWSQQNPLPLPSDPLESLYTNPPNTGGSGSGSNSSSPGTNDEQDRQKFEGALNSFYATRNATAVRLANYVSAASAALYCEKLSTSATQALLEFPVDPTPPANPSPVESEVLLTGLSTSSSGNTNFGVPAAFFYAQGINMDKSATGDLRYQIACGDTVERLLLQFGQAVSDNAISDSEAFSYPLPTWPNLTVPNTSGSINSAQAARRLSALGVSSASTCPVLSLTSSVSGPLVTPVVQAWLAPPPAPAGASSEFSFQYYQPSSVVAARLIVSDYTIWRTIEANHRAGFLQLVLVDLTQAYGSPGSAPPGQKPWPLPGTTLADLIAAWLPTTTNPATPSPTVDTLKAVTPTQWTSFFNTFLHTKDPSADPLAWFPPFTQPGSISPAGATQSGYITACIKGFVRAVQRFFTVSSVPNQPSLPAPGAPPNFQIPPFDAIGQAALTFGFAFGKQSLTATEIATAVATVYPPGTDEETQAWLAQSLATINELYQIASVVKDVSPLPPTPAPPAASPSPPAIPGTLAFSVMEALYARGFTSAKSIAALSSGDFQQALTGTVAYSYATSTAGTTGTSLYTEATKLSPPPAATTPTSGPFTPVNPDGTLTNCVPPRCLSPLGPVAYLQQLLQLPVNATCENLGNSQSANANTLTLGTALATRRGPLGALLATGANLETPLPLIDLVNECLEAMVVAVNSTATPPPTPTGTVYQTSGDVLAGYPLCAQECCEDDAKESAEACYKPTAIFAALPEHSSPATPLAATQPATPGTSNQAVEPAAFNFLKEDFSSCCLPYSQALDVNRTYLRHFGTCRYEEMRTFRRCITEFVLAPTAEPTGFQDHLWRYPVRIDIAIEYLGITPEEYQSLFNGPPPAPCAGGPATQAPSELFQRAPWLLYGFSQETTGGENAVSWTQVVRQLSEFLRCACLTYCEFLELYKSGFGPFSNAGATTTDSKAAVVTYPDCEPCCLEKWSLPLPEAASPALFQLAVFIRLWRKLKDLCGAGYSFSQLSDICNVLGLFTTTNNAPTLNPDFIRQLAAFQIFRDQFHLALVDLGDKPAPGATGADRTHLLALWAGAGAAKWNWAVKQMLEGIERNAQRRHGCERRSHDFLKVFASSLDSLSQLAGYTPGSAAPTDDRWQAAPTHTLRFAEVLAKIYASHFRVDELIYIFTAGQSWETERPFPLQEKEEALSSPLSLPHDEHEFSLWKLRHRLLEAEVGDEGARRWSWHAIEASLQNDFGYAAANLLDLGRHFFPGILQAAGYLADASHRRYTTPLSAPTQFSGTAPGGPFQYDATQTAPVLWVQLPLRDEEMIGQLERLQQLSQSEAGAVQDLYYQPRNTLAPLAFLFTDFVKAQEHLIEGRDEHERWSYFQRQFALCHARCRILAEHLGRHVEGVTGAPHPDGTKPAFLVLRALFADESRALTPWENNSGAVPKVAWTPPNGGAFAALLGLTGTGLLREYTPAGATGTSTVAWRDVSGPSSGFGAFRDRQNCPAPCVIPSLLFNPSPAPATATIRNGLAVDNSSGAWLGGAQGFTVTWSGALLVERDGRYDFCAGAPAPDCEPPHQEASSQQQWRVTLQRGQKTWLLVNHHWAGETGSPSPYLPLRQGAYDITVDFLQPAPAFSSSTPRQHTGIQVKYSGPDTEERLEEIPHHRLFRVEKILAAGDDPKLDRAGSDLGAGIAPPLATNAASFLAQYYTSSLRDIRRTYQRAFKALLFVHRFGLSAEQLADRQSELGYLLANPANFAGLAYYLPAGGTPTAFQSHSADFDFNFLPLVDDYFAPTAAQDARVQPSPQRTQALFDWWERIFDYDGVRRAVRAHGDRHLWLLFQQASVLASAGAAGSGSLLEYLGAAPRHWPIDLSYYQDQNTVYPVTNNDLADDRWVVRAWHADRWLTALERSFTVKDITKARPDLWASDDPSATVNGAGPGNANLQAFLKDGALGNGRLPRYEELQRLNDGLRERARHALLAYLTSLGRVSLPWVTGHAAVATVPRDLGDYLLLDVETGICEKASRIEDAITAVQNFVRRAWLGLEPTWIVNREFALVWERHFADFRLWETCKRRELYKENWIEWDALHEARRIEAFRFLESKLQTAALTVVEPGGGEWWPAQPTPAHRGLALLQASVSSTVQQLSAATAPSTQEGWTLLGTPESDARPSWLAAPSLSSNGAAGVGTIAASVAQSTPPTTSSPANLPLWLEAATRLGTQFIRVAAAGQPSAFAGNAPNRERSHAGCCLQCGRVHPPVVDEYYFWLVDAQVFLTADQPNAALANSSGGSGSSAPDTGSFQFGVQDSYYDQTQQQSIAWNDPTQLPPLLNWPTNPAVRLAWCRTHNGEFSQPRRSVEYVEIKTPASIQFLGRANDSLFFSISGAEPSPSGDTDTSTPGFRYDLPTDDAVALPQAVPWNFTAEQFPGGLPAYPFFAYNTPGARLFPNGFFAPAIAVADALRTRCRFDLALKWYELAFAPLQNDCTWIECPEPQTTASAAVEIAATNHAAVGSPAQGACCDSTEVTDEMVRNRAVTLHYCQTLLDWGVHLMRHRRNPEAFQQTRLVLDTVEKITGRRPRTVLLPEPASPQPVSSFTPAIPPLNPRLLDIYDRTADHMGMIRACIGARRLRNGRPGCDMPYFGESPLRDGWRTKIDRYAEETEWCLLHSPYRFTFLIQKALELAAGVREFGTALLSAYEKGDAEYLASIRAVHERELLSLGLTIRQNQWRDADWQIQALQQTKDLNQTNLIYYNNLYQNGLITDEIQHQSLATTAMQTRTSSSVVEAVGGAMKVIPDLYLALSPESKIPVGTKLAGVFETIGQVIRIFADIQSETAALDLTLAGWQRRSDEWLHQTQTLPLEIQQIEMQILGAQRRRAVALQELNNQQRQIEQSTETLNFLRDKFTSDKLYLWMQKETSVLHSRMYELAIHAARQAERAFNFERGHTTRRFIPDDAWDTLHEGLLAGETLELALRRMEKAYLDENVREYELIKHFSLRLHFPMEFLRLRITGRCEIELPEWMFDLDYPGQYMRRIKNVTLTIPCVAGPYNGVHCRLTLLQSTTRIDSRLGTPPAHCCGECKSGNDYEACPHDPRVVRQYAAREAIATSSGQNDSGLFELNFRDERYLPFEFQGAVSRWRIELPPENNYFELDSLSDVMLHLNYTSREGGDLLRTAASRAAHGRLPGAGWTFFDVRHEFPDAWELFQTAGRKNNHAKRLDLRLTRNLFPFVPGGRELWVDKIVILFETPDDPASECDAGGECSCPEKKIIPVHKVTFAPGRGCREERDEEKEFLCTANDAWPNLYYGAIEKRLGPLGGKAFHHEAIFRFPSTLHEIPRVFVLCRYEIRTPSDCNLTRANAQI